jgi:hypothetical protein
LLEFTNAILNTSSINDKKITKNYFLASGLASALLASAFLASAFSAFSFGVITLGRGLSLESALGAGADAVVAGLSAGFFSAGLSAATATRERVVSATAVNAFMDFIESPNLFQDNIISYYTTLVKYLSLTGIIFSSFISNIVFGS